MEVTKDLALEVAVQSFREDERNVHSPNHEEPLENPISPLKRKRELLERSAGGSDTNTRRTGTAPIKAEFLIHHDKASQAAETAIQDDDAAEAFHHVDRSVESNNSKRRKKSQGQNKNRSFGKSQDKLSLCQSRAHAAELSPGPCSFGDGCRFEHNLRRYLREHKRPDLTNFNGKCPTWETKGFCPAGWKCRFVGSHSKEVEQEHGVKELILVEDERRCSGKPLNAKGQEAAEQNIGIRNVLTVSKRMDLTKRKFSTPKADAYCKWIEQPSQIQKNPTDDQLAEPNETSTMNSEELTTGNMQETQNDRAQYHEPPTLPSEKRRLYFGPETPVLAPLTTQGNLPFRRLCISLGAQFTYSEMAMSVPLLQGARSEWALMKAHDLELAQPTFTPSLDSPIVSEYSYDQSKDFRFGAQIAGNKPWNVLKATEALTALLPGGLRVIDLNCGCPIDLVYREGAGSALLDQPTKLEKILRGMNSVSGEVPVSVKIRTGTKDNRPTAQKLIDRLVLGGQEASDRGLGPPGVAAITLHGRSRQQRYTRKADWEYIAECSALIKRLQAKEDDLTDTIREADPRSRPPGTKTFFLGNGDCYSHEHYNAHLEQAGVSTVMVGRGALMKPWVFEEIATNQYLDKSASERLGYVEQFVRFGLEAWGSDEIGVGTTRRFLLEWLSFTCRYVPVGLLDVLPPNLQERPPAYRGRNELETLLASENYRDWIKIR